MGLCIAGLPEEEEEEEPNREVISSSANGEEKMVEIVEESESSVEDTLVVPTNLNVSIMEAPVVFMQNAAAKFVEVEEEIPLDAIGDSQLVSPVSLADTVIIDAVTMDVEFDTQRMEEGVEVPIGNGDESIVRTDIDELLDIGEEKSDEERDDDRENDLDDPKEMNGEGGEYDLEEHSLPISERRKHKRLEVFIGGLDKETTDEDLKAVFKKFGEVMEVRLMRNPQTGKNKGYAFIRYSSAAMAKHAAEELEHVEIRGRPCGVLPSEENDTLFLGNISKSWKKEVVVETLKNLGIENIEEITLMEDPQLEGINRGFAFIEFITHKEALKAFRRLQQSDAIFGTERSAKVAWAQPLNEPDEGTMSQVKSVFVDGMPSTWDEEKVMEHFGRFGEIERIVLARNMLSAKRKDFGFVNYVERDAAMACIEAIHNTDFSDGDIKMKVKVMLAKPQLKSKAAKGGVRGGYPLGFRGDHRIGSSPGRLGRGMGLPYDAPSWGISPHSDNQGRSGGGRDRGGAGRADRKGRRGGKRNHDEMDSRNKLLHTMQDQAAVDDLSAGLEDEEKHAGPEEPEGAPVLLDGDAGIINAGNSIGADQSVPIAGEIITKPALEKFECAMCGFGSDSPNDFESHKKTKVHTVIEGLRKDLKLHNKTPLSLLHEYASRNHCEVNYETKTENNCPFEVTVMIGGAAGGATGPPTRGFGVGRNKARAKQMAAADALEKIMEEVPESEFTKPGQSRQRAGDRDRPGRKGKGGGGGSGGGGGGRGYRNSRGRAHEDWRSGNDVFKNLFAGAGNSGGGVGGGGRNRRHAGNNMYFEGGGGGGYHGNPNTIPLSRFNDFPLGGGDRSAYGYRFSRRGGGGYNPLFRGSRGGMPTLSETYAERYGRVQNSCGYGGGGCGGRDFGGGGDGVFGGHDMAGNGFGGRELPPPVLSFGGRDLPPGGYSGPTRELENSCLKRPFAPMDEETRFLDAQSGLRRPRLEAPEQVPVQPAGGAQSYVAQSMYAEAARLHTSARAPILRPQEQQPFNAYGQPPHGVPVGHNVGQAHVPTQQPSVPAAIVGGPCQGGTPYSIYDAAPQPHAAPPSGSQGQNGALQTPTPHVFNNQYAPATHNYATSYTVNQDYMVNTPTPVQEMTQAMSYPTQLAYGAQYAVIQQVSQQAGCGYALQTAAQQQTYY